MSRLVRWLRLDDRTRTRWSLSSTVSGVAALTVGSYAVLAFDRFGLQGFSEPRGPARLVLVGFYGWIGLTVAAWLTAGRSIRGPGTLSRLFRLLGHAHVPLLALAVVIQGLSITGQIQGPARTVAIFTILFWMPAMLVKATRTALGLDSPAALLAVGGPYLLWLLIVGRYLLDQVGHLL